MKGQELHKAYTDLFKSGLVQDSVIREQIRKYAMFDDLLVGFPSFYYIIKVAVGHYLFLGRQQEAISGVNTEQFIKEGIGAFLKRVHPEEIDIVINQIYPDFIAWLAEVSQETDIARENVVFQYNYRFMSRQGTYVNLMEYVYVLQADGEGKATHLLGNVIPLGENAVLPVKSAMIVHRGMVAETRCCKNYNIVQGRYNLTSRERDILKNLATGRTSKEIAQSLFISPHTVDTHRRNLLRKMNCRSVVELAREAIINGLV